MSAWREMLPVIQALTCPDLKDRHWAKINQVLGVRLVRDKNLTLQSLLELEVRHGSVWCGIPETCF